VNLKRECGRQSRTCLARKGGKKFYELVGVKKTSSGVGRGKSEV